jgi:hypothetical protein
VSDLRVALACLIACKDAKDEACVTKVAVENVRLALDQIREQSPYLAQRIDSGTVGLVGAL